MADVTESQRNSLCRNVPSDNDGIYSCRFKPSDSSASSEEDRSAALLDKKEGKHIDDVLSELQFGWFHVKMVLLAGGGYFAICSQLLVFVFLSKPVKSEWQLDDLMFPWLPFFSGVCGIMGGYVFGTVSDRFGRQKPFIISIAIVAIFGTASAFSQSFIVLIILRSLVSIGTGGLEAVDFVLLLEFLPKKNRGSFMVAITFCGALGAVLAGGLAWWLLPRYGWRTFVGACAAPSIIIFVLRLRIGYESPRFLFISDRKQKALAVLKEIAKQNGTEMPKGEIVCSPSTKRGRILDLFCPNLRRRTIGISLVWFLQATGYWGVTIYLPEYMASLGVDPYFNMFTIFVGELPGLCLAMILIERHMLGRIRCLRFFSLLTVLSILLFAFVNVIFLKAVLVVICYFSMVPIYAILNTFTPEIYPTDIRSTAMAWVNILIEIPGLITPFVGATLLRSNLPWLYPVVWGVVFVLQFICTLMLGKETAGNDLNDSNKLMSCSAVE